MAAGDPITHIPVATPPITADPHYVALLGRTADVEVARDEAQTAAAVATEAAARIGVIASAQDAGGSDTDDDLLLACQRYIRGLSFADGIDPAHLVVERIRADATTLQLRLEGLAGTAQAGNVWNFTTPTAQLTDVMRATRLGDGSGAYSWASVDWNGLLADPDLGNRTIANHLTPGARLNAAACRYGAPTAFVAYLKQFRLYDADSLVRAVLAREAVRTNQTQTQGQWAANQSVRWPDGTTTAAPTTFQADGVTPDYLRIPYARLPYDVLVIYDTFAAGSATRVVAVATGAPKP